MIRRIPDSTYRLQLNPQCTFDQTRQALHYLQALGVSWLYLAPITQPNPGSLHGYDVINYNQVNPETGGIDGFNQLAHALQSLHMGLLVDFVPNHMAATRNNPWWQALLTQGLTSPYATYFDVFTALSKPEALVYRRFFDIQELVCLRMEDPQVFLATHQLILKLLGQQLITGLRLDHIDGLKNPEAYLNLLATHLNQPTYIVIEKVLGRNESLPDTWKTSGTTGYDFLNELNQIFVDQQGFMALLNEYENKLTDSDSINDIRRRNNKLIILSTFHHEFEHLVHSFQDIAQMQGHNFVKEDIEKVLLEICDVIPVYRTYIHEYPISTHDKQIIATILAKVRTKSLNFHCLQFFEQITTCPHPETIHDEVKQTWLNWISYWQVFTGPVVAKGYEDTTCYQFNPLISLNEVGSEPLFFKVSILGDISVFHRYNLYKQAHYPESLNATSTHDTKHSEDVRARLNVLTEIPAIWNQALTRWQHWNILHKTIINGQLAPDTNDELMLYQTLLGAWPLDADHFETFKLRIQGFLTKAEREAKIHSNWQHPNPDYEAACIAFFDKIVTPDPENYFLADFLKLQQQVSFFGMLNSLSQVALKITCPGIPDIYQGNEVWQFDLVDPDNRHAVDFELMANLLHSLNHATLATLLDSWPDGRIKLFLTQKLLNLRRDYPLLFSQGEYLPLISIGAKADNLFTFARRHQDNWLIIAIPRWYTQLCHDRQFPLGDGIWQDTQLTLPTAAPSHWRSALTDEVISSQKQSIEYFLPVSQALSQFPIGIFLNITHMEEPTQARL